MVSCRQVAKMTGNTSSVQIMVRCRLQRRELEIGLFEKQNREVDSVVKVVSCFGPKTPHRSENPLLHYSKIV